MNSKHKISVLTWCQTRQHYLNATLGAWMEQKDVDYEIVVGRGPNVHVPEHWNDPLVKTTVINKLGINNAYNRIMAAASGDILLITQCDMMVIDPCQLRKMLDRWNERTMVTEKFMKEGKRDQGVYLQFMMVAKSAVEAVGGWYEGYDCPTTAAHEDADLVCRLMRHGLDLEMMESPTDKTVYHLDHPKPDYFNDPVVLERLKNGKALFDSRNPEGVMHLYAKQMVRNLAQRHCNV